MPEILIGQITSVPNKMISDTTNNKITINIQNLGDKDAELVKANLEIHGTSITPSYSYSLEDSTSSISAGSQETLTFTIDIEEDAQVETSATLHLRYRAQKSVGNMYETFEKKINLTIQLTPSPHLIISNVEQLSDFKIGTTENKLKITLLNDGIEDAKEVRVRIVPDISYPFIFEETTMYVSAKNKTTRNSKRNLHNRNQ